MNLAEFRTLQRTRDSHMTMLRKRTSVSGLANSRICQSWAENNEITEISLRHHQRSESWIGFSVSVCRKVVDMAAGVLLFVTVAGLAASGNLVKWNGKIKNEKYRVPPFISACEESEQRKMQTSVFSSVKGIWNEVIFHRLHKQLFP